MREILTNPGFWMLVAAMTAGVAMAIYEERRLRR